MTARTRQTLIDRAHQPKPWGGQEMVDLVDTMFSLENDVKKTLADVAKQVNITKIEKGKDVVDLFSSLKGTGFLTNHDGNWLFDDSEYLTMPAADARYSAINHNHDYRYPLKTLTITAGRGLGGGGDLSGDFQFDVDFDSNGISQQVSRADHVHGVTLAGDLDGYGDIGGTLSPSVIKIRGGSVPTLAAGFLQWTGSSFVWAPATPITTVTLNDLADVTLSTVSNNQILKFDTTSGQWINWTPNFTTGGPYASTAHASTHHYGGSDALSGQSIAGLRTSDSPSWENVTVASDLRLVNANTSIAGNSYGDIVFRTSNIIRANLGNSDLTVYVSLYPGASGANLGTYGLEWNASLSAARVSSFGTGFVRSNSSGVLSSSALLTSELPGGPYLPLSAGLGFPLSGDLYLNGNTLYLESSPTQAQIFTGSTYIGALGRGKTWRFGNSNAAFASSYSVSATFNEGLDSRGTSYFDTLKSEQTYISSLYSRSTLPITVNAKLRFLTDSVIYVDGSGIDLTTPDGVEGTTIIIQGGGTNAPIAFPIRVPTGVDWGVRYRTSTGAFARVGAGDQIDMHYRAGILIAGSDGDWHLLHS